MTYTQNDEYVYMVRAGEEEAGSPVSREAGDTDKTLPETHAEVSSIPE